MEWIRNIQVKAKKETVYPPERVHVPDSWIRYGVIQGNHCKIIQSAINFEQTNSFSRAGMRSSR